MPYQVTCAGDLLAIKSRHPEVEGVAPVGQANYFQLVAECTKKKERNQSNYHFSHK